jgi:hypothetical protein
VLALAIRWVLDQPGVSVALWGARHPSELDPVSDVMGWKLDADALAVIAAIVNETVLEPVGPEFMAPPIGRPSEVLGAAGLLLAVFGRVINVIFVLFMALYLTVDAQSMCEYLLVFLPANHRYSASHQSFTYCLGHSRFAF